MTRFPKTISGDLFLLYGAAVTLVTVDAIFAGHVQPLFIINQRRKQ